MSGDWALPNWRLGNHEATAKGAEEWPTSRTEAKRGGGVLEALWHTCFKKEGTRQGRVSPLPLHSEFFH